MCGIVGVIGLNPEASLISRLKQLEYRGYDSAGVAVKNDGLFNVFKVKGGIDNLKKVVVAKEGVKIGIGHTRWATHGKPDEINAHPHLSHDKKWVVVHNGIIENYIDIKQKLSVKGEEFYSETDTETVAKLLEFYDEEDKLSVIGKTCNALDGSYALAVMNSDTDGIFFAKNKSPLFVAKEGKNIIIASDIICFYGFSDFYYPLEDGEYGFVSENEFIIRNKFGVVKKDPQRCEFGDYSVFNNYRHYMLKEIYETKGCLKNIYDYYNLEENRKKISNTDFSGIKKVRLVGCGTAYHACLMGARYIEEETDLEASAYVASEFRYYSPKLGADTLVVLVSQSGETADTLAAFKTAKDGGALTLSVVNVEYSTLAKSTDMCMPIKAGVEVAVASTKAYSAQLVVLYILALIISSVRSNKSFDLNAVCELYEKFSFAEDNGLKLLADVLRYNDRLFMIGRGADYYTALEAGLKIKETSYINCDTYFAGELKHGFLALIDSNTYLVVFATDEKVFQKTLCNAEEARARGAKIILCTCFDTDESLCENFHHVVKVKKLGGALQGVINIVPWQLIAYYVSVNKGINPDKPRNLAKSVTVE